MRKRALFPPFIFYGGNPFLKMATTRGFGIKEQIRSGYDDWKTTPPLPHTNPLFNLFNGELSEIDF